MRNLGFFVFLGVGLFGGMIANDLGMNLTAAYFAMIIPALLAGWATDKIVAKFFRRPQQLEVKGLNR